MITRGPAQQLRSEHVRTVRILELLGHVIERMVRAGEVPGSDLGDALELVHQFVDRYHHAREDLLFDALRRADPDPLEVPLDRLGQEHDRLRALISAARAQAPAAARGDEQARATVAHVVREYVKLSEEHLALEETQVFPFAEEELTEAASKSLEADLAADEARRPAGWLQDVAALQARLEAGYG